MKVVELGNSVQVRDGRGRLIRAFTTVGEATAYTQGYEMGQREVADVIRDALTTTLASLSVEGGER